MGASIGTIDAATGEEIFFDIVVHLGTLGAIIIYFRNEITDLIKAFFKASAISFSKNG